MQTMPSLCPTPATAPAINAHLLVVEDSHDLASAMVSQLGDHGFQVDTCEDGFAALEMMRNHSFDLVVLDWMLPGMSGLAILERLRHTSAIPVLMVTGRGEEMDRVTGLERGADDYLVKPFGKHELVARVRALLRRSRFQQNCHQQDVHVEARIIENLGLSLDLEAHQVFLEGNPVRLTPLEFQLLHLFLCHPQRVFSRNYLLEKLWQGVVSGCDRSVDNAVLRLRKKLRNWTGSIETVWGVGYRFSPSCRDKK